MPTSRQQQVLDYIVQRFRSGRPPTLREICAHTGITSTNGVNDHLKALERKGLLQRTAGKHQARGWRPTTAVGVWLAATTPEHALTVEVLAKAWDELPPGMLKAIRDFVEKTPRYETTRRSA